MSIDFEVQKSIENALRSRRSLVQILAVRDIDRGIYDTPPQIPEGAADNSFFPYVSLGSDSFIADDTDTTNGIDALITIHCWSRQPSFSECKRICGEIRAELHHSEMPIFGLNVTNIRYLQAEYMTDADGKTKHGTIEFQLLATIL